jgi:hypothetical protein
MSDLFTFVFGLIATILAVGPLAVAAILDLRDRNRKRM